MFGIVLFIFGLGLSFAGESTLHCRPKVGCDLAKCEPIPGRWLRLGVDVQDYIERSEFPMLCEETGKENKKETKLGDISLALRKELSKMIDAKMSPVLDHITKLEKRLDDLSSKIEVETTNGKEVGCFFPKRIEVCPSMCQPTCNNLKPTSCQKRCNPVTCVCSPGFVMKSIQDDTCVKPSECPKLCKSSMIYALCPTKCAQTCGDPKPICTRVCDDPRCVCPRGHFLIKPDTEICVEESKCLEYCRVRYDTSCIWKIERSRITYENAVQLCKNRNGRPANVYDKNHLRNLGASFEMHNRKHFWTGMKYNTLFSLVTYYDGSRASYPGDITIERQRFLGSTFETSKKTNVYASSHALETILYREAPSAKLDGVLCEI